MNIKQVANKFRLRGEKRSLRTINRPRTFNLSNWFAVGALLMILGLTISAPVVAYAQAASTGSTVETGQTVQGENAGQVEGTLANVTNFVGNVLCPIGAGLMVVSSVVQFRSGKNWHMSGVTAGALVGVSAITRLIEGFVTTAKAVGQ